VCSDKLPTQNLCGSVKLKSTLLFVSLLALSGCATQTFNVQGGGPEEPTQETVHHFFISGLGQSKELDAAAVCGGAERVARVQTELRFLDGLLGAVTSGIYTPRTARVYCQ